MAKRTKRVHGEWAPSLPFTDRAFRPYALALGEIALAWNDLHVSLSFVFCGILSVGNFNFGPFQAVWQQITNDRGTRRLCRASRVHRVGAQRASSSCLRPNPTRSTPRPVSLAPFEVPTQGSAGQQA